MSEAPERRADPALRARKLRDASVLLPLGGAILFLPPAASIFALPVRLGGVPLAVAYVFLVWAALILAARVVGRRLGGDAAPGPRNG